MNIANVDESKPSRAAKPVGRARLSMLRRDRGDYFSTLRLTENATPRTCARLIAATLTLILVPRSALWTSYVRWMAPAIVLPFRYHL